MFNITLSVINEYMYKEYCNLIQLGNTTKGGGLYQESTGRMLAHIAWQNFPSDNPLDDIYSPISSF